MRRGWETEVRHREEGGGGGSGGGGLGGKRSTRAMRLGSRWRGWWGRKGGEGRGGRGSSGGEGGAVVRGAHYVFRRRIWNPINQAEERRDAERMRSPFTLMRPGRGKRSTT